MSLDVAATEGVKALCFCVSREIGYQRQLNPNMEDLERCMHILTAKYEDNMSEVECARSEGGSALNEVTNWLKKVECMKMMVSDTQRNFAEQKNCWKGCFPNFYRRQKISKRSLKLISQVNNLITDGKFENGVTIEPLPLATNALPTMPVRGKTAKLTQREILDCILGTEKPIIGVHGMRGVGKTTIMRNIHNDLSQQSKSKHFNCFIWITVSNNVDVNKLQRKIAKELKIVMEEDDDEDVTARKIYNALKWRKKFLLILDDMWKQFDLVEVGIPIPSEENGCKVVLTTRDKGVCGQMQAHAIEVRVLTKDESWEFFKNIVGGVILSKDIESLARDVAKECCNLPLAIKTVGGSMRGVDNARAWKCALKNLKEANGKFEGINQQIASPQDPVEETNNTGDALLSEGRQIISTNGGSFIDEVPQNITAADTVAGASKIGGSLPSESRQVTSAEGMPHNQEPISVHVQAVLDSDSVEANIIGSPLVLEDRRITAPEDPVVKANETGSSLLSKNRPFTYDEVNDITNGFKTFLGQGAFGMVFHGEMTDGTELAVKRLFPKSGKLPSELSKQFENEAQLLMRAHHPNVVPFIGYCQEGDNMALIYEYMAEGDLGSHLLGKKGDSKALNWDQRLHIGLDVAQGLEYLHGGCNPPIIHRDIKTANILLNERFEAKIGDFGLSKVFLEYNESSHISTGIKGTEGYIDPEYDTSKHLTKKSDVYSFGVVLFQLITAKSATFRRDGTNKLDLVDWANRTIALAPIECVLDPKLEGFHDANSLKKAAEIARLCTSKKSEERPTMCEVVAKLKDCLEIEVVAKRIRVLVNIEQQVE